MSYVCAWASNYAACRWRNSSADGPGEMNALLLGSVDENLNYVIAIANILLLTLVTPLTASLATLWIDWRLGLVMLLVFPLLVPFYYWRRPGDAATDADAGESASAAER